MDTSFNFDTLTPQSLQHKLVMLKRESDALDEELKKKKKEEVSFVISIWSLPFLI